MPCVTRASQKNEKYWPKGHVVRSLLALPDQRIVIEPMSDADVESDLKRHRPNKSISLDPDPEEVDNEWGVVGHTLSTFTFHILFHRKAVVPLGEVRQNNSLLQSLC